MDIQIFKEQFRKHFQSEPIVVRSPGRINIIGEHTDYNGGFVLPAAINKAIYVGVAKRDDRNIRFYSARFSELYETTLDTLSRSSSGWTNYIAGVADQLLKRGYSIGGFDLYIDGTIPLGAGLSSSAAVECATAYALDQLFELGISRMHIAQIAQQAEHVFAGVNCGIMDQFASVFGKKDEAMLLDCRSMEYRYVPLALGGYKLLLLNTNVQHSLAESGYNNRRAKCEQGVAWIKEKYPQVETLRDANMQMLDEMVRPRDMETYHKCKYVIEENGRLLAATAQLEAGNLEELGKLMLATHEGLSNDFEVSCPELDFLVDCVRDNPDVPGARMMGGGFGGCTLNIVKSGTIQQLAESIGARYEEKFGRKMDYYIVETDEGTGMIGY